MQNILETLGIELPEHEGATTESTVVSITVESVTPDAALVTTGDGRTAILPVSEYYPHRRWQVGDTMVALLSEGPRLPMCSVVRPELVEAIYDGIVPELLSGQVRIMSVARAAGVRAKVAVATTGGTVDPLAAMIGREANRVRLVSDLLGGERIDIVAWNPDPEIYLANVLAPAKVTRVVLTDHGATAYAPPHQMSAAVGHGGLNSQLAGQLLGMPVVIVVDPDR